ncbi:hypothetical protein RQP46_010403 [Phenoliferia psychrophenolica]
MAAAPVRTTEAQAASILDPTQECTAYSYAPTSHLTAQYPKIWVTADLSNAGIPASDKALFASMNSSIPKIAPKGTRAGDFTSVKGYTAADPDCWFTLDDGPNCSHNAYYDYLSTIDQKATLFYIGSNVLDWPLEAQRGLEDGHEVCAHTWSHPYMTAMTNEQAFAELYYSKKAIKDVLGITVNDVDDRIRWIANALDMITIVWEEDTFDWDWSVIGIPAVEQNYENILARQANGTYSTAGAIMLSHELNNETMVLSEKFLPQIQKQFTGGVMPVAVCMNNTEPYLEGAAYKYPNYVQYAAGTHSLSLAAPAAATGNVNLVFTSGGVASATATGPAMPTSTISIALATSAGIASSGEASKAPSAQTTGSSSSTSGAVRREVAALFGLLSLAASLTVL